MESLLILVGRETPSFLSFFFFPFFPSSSSSTTSFFLFFPLLLALPASFYTYSKGPECNMETFLLC